MAQEKKSAKTTSSKTSVKKRATRDVIVTPTIKQIETSIREGVTRSAADFRALAGW